MKKVDIDLTPAIVVDFKHRGMHEFNIIRTWLNDNCPGEWARYNYTYRVEFTTEEAAVMAILQFDGKRFYSTVEQMIKNECED